MGYEYHLVLVLVVILVCIGLGVGGWRNFVVCHKPILKLAFSVHLTLNLHPPMIEVNNTPFQQHEHCQLGILSPIGVIPQFGRFCQICSENTP